MSQIKDTEGTIRYYYQSDGTPDSIPDGYTLKLQILKADGSELWTEEEEGAPVEVEEEEDANGDPSYPYTLTAADNDASEPRKAVWTLWDGEELKGTDIEEFDVLYSANVYCTELGVRSLGGSVALQANYSIATFIQSASDIINTALKAKYVTPIVTENREDQKILKIITECLAGALMIEAMSVGTEAAETTLRSAAKLHYRAMTGVLSDGMIVQPGLKAITEGVFTLEGAELRENVTSSAGAYAGVKAKKTRDYDGNPVEQGWCDQVYGTDLD